MLLDGQIIQAIQAKNVKIFAGLTRLNFRIDYRAEGGEGRLTISDSGGDLDFELIMCEKSVQAFKNKNGIEIMVSI